MYYWEDLTNAANWLNWDCSDHIVCVFMTLLCGVILVVVYVKNSVCVTISVWRHSSDIENMILLLTCCWCLGCQVVIRFAIMPRLFLIHAYLLLTIELFMYFLEISFFCLFFLMYFFKFYHFLDWLIETIHNLSNGATFNDREWPFDLDFKVRTFLKSNIVKTARLKDKVAIAQEETIPNYGMVLTYVWWPSLTSKCVARVCQHQLSFLLLREVIKFRNHDLVNVLYRLQISIAFWPPL